MGVGRDFSAPTPLWRGARSAQVVMALVVAFIPSAAHAQYGRDAVVSRIVELANRDASSASLVGIVESGRLAQGQDVSRAYRLQAGQCYWFFGTGDGNIHDLDLMVSHRGTVVIRDQGATREVVVPGGRPYCPAEEQRVQVRVVAFRGGGMYATALYSAAGTEDAQSQAGDIGTLLDRAATRHAAGMKRSISPTVRRLAENEDLSVEVRLTGGMCYRFVAVGGEGVEDLGLRVYQGASEIGRDDATASEATASYCATADTTVRARLQMETGSGEVAIAAYSGGRQQAASQSTPAQPAIPVGGEGDDYLSRQIRAHHGRVGQGRNGVSQMFRASLRASQDRAFPVRLEGGRCYTIIAVGAPSVRDLDLFLISPNGMEQERDAGPNNHAIVNTDPCPRWSGTYNIRLRVFSGYGNVAVQAFGN